MAHKRVLHLKFSERMAKVLSGKFFGDDWSLSWLRLGPVPPHLTARGEFSTPPKASSDNGPVEKTHFQGAFSDPIRQKSHHAHPKGFSELKTHPNLHTPGLSRSNGSHIEFSSKRGLFHVKGASQGGGVGFLLKSPSPKRGRGARGRRVVWGNFEKGGGGFEPKRDL